jgi:hypothetical protein
VPELHVPLEEKVLRVVALAQVGTGGLLQVTPAQGLPWHAPALQPEAHVVSVEVYVQPEALQMPTVLQLRRVVAFVQVGAGGVLQATSLPPQTPVVHLSFVVHMFPSSQPAPSAKGYVHAPALQVPVLA